MSDFLQDLKYGMRMLWKRPGFTAVAVLSLALGIGANTTIFTMINAVFLQPIPVEEPSRVVMLYGTDATNAQGVNPLRFQPISRLNAEDYRDRSSVFTGVTLMGFAGLALSSGSGDPEQVFAQLVSGNYFDLLGAKPAVGRGFLPEEDSTPGTHPVVVLSDGVWKRRFGGDASVVGRNITLNGRAFTVVGVAPPGFNGTFAFGGPDMYMPMAMFKHVVTGILLDWYDARRARILFTIARLKPEVTLAQAQAEVTSIGKQ
ncbi:MAG TPA: ABC transporter permease, partial [Candidatus Acidoferrales bacterium]